MIQPNNAPLLGRVVDISGLSEKYRDGQKLRQEYEARQQQKALNEIMKVGDHNGRLELAQQHKYAGALVPQLQKYEEDRQKAALDNLKTSADIGKVYGEIGELGAKTGEIGVKTQGQTIKNMTDKYSQISAGALTQNPQYFAVMLGDFEQNGLINPDQKGAIIDMMMKDPENAAKVMQQLARGTIEGFKATSPEAKVLDGKDAAYMYSVDQYTGEAGQPTQRVAYGQSPDNFATNETSRANNQNTVAGSMYNSDNSLKGTMYNADTNYQGRIDTANISANTASEKTAVDWYKAQTGAAVAQQNANTAATKAQPVVGANGQPVRKLNTTEQKKLFEIQDQQNADKSVIQVLDKMMKLTDETYSGFAATGRAKGMSNIGLAGEKANNTVLYDNLATSQALAQLKATFGAAPTEGERKILMDIQASASKTPMQKKQIIAQAFRAVQARQAYREKLANGIRTGQYMIPTAPTTTKPKTKSKTQNNAGASIIGGILGGG